MNGRCNCDTSEHTALAFAERSRLRVVLKALIDEFPELAKSHATAPQQHALWDAMQALEEIL